MATPAALRLEADPLRFPLGAADDSLESRKPLNLGSVAEVGERGTGRLEGKAILITGGSGGLGRATALEVAREGARFVGVHYAKSKERAVAVAAGVKELGATPLLLRARVERRTEAHRLVEQFVKAAGRLDALVCFAGHLFLRRQWFSKFEDLTEAELLPPFRTDLLGSVFAAQAAGRVMRRQRSGSIVLIGSTPAITGDTVGISYMIAKAGVLALTRALAQVYGPHNIQVNAIAPGAIRTQPRGDLTEREIRPLIEEAALKRLGTAEEIAAKAAFLCSDDASFMSGVTLVVDGGYAMR